MPTLALFHSFWNGAYLDNYLNYKAVYTMKKFAQTRKILHTLTLFLKI